jgi:hypothetical protein
MSDAEALREKLLGIAAELDGAQARTPEEHDHLRVAREQLHRVISVLVARGVLNKVDARMMRDLEDSARRPSVHLNVVDSDKYTTPNSEVDCDARIHLCHARCCSFAVALSRQDLDQGELEWQIESPYLLARAADRYCAYLRTEEEGGGCTKYEHRPAVCRKYDCRNDRRVWIDFEQRIPAPMPEGQTPRFVRKG